MNSNNLDLEQGATTSPAPTDIKDEHLDDIGNSLGPCDSIDTYNRSEKQRSRRSSSRRTLDDQLHSDSSSRGAREPPEQGEQTQAEDVDGNLVSWDGPDDPEDPRNWKRGRKWAATVVVSSFTLISSLSSSMVAPALSDISRDLHIHNEVLTQMCLSIFVLAYAFGPLLLGPLSEIFGRVPVLQLSNLVFLVWNLACGFATNSAELIVFRFISGLGGSAPLAIGAGVLADTFTAEERGLAVAIYTLGPLLGPAIGPVAGGFIAETIDWRWGFWIITIADAVVQIIGLFFLRETYRPVLLARKLKRKKQETGNEGLYAVETNAGMTLRQKLATSFARPLRLLFTQPIIICLASYMAFIYGIMYIIISTFTTLFTDHYGESIGIAGLNYIAMGLGFFVGAQGTARLTDSLYARLKKRNGGVGRPEFRILIMIPCAIGVPIGLFWYGWSAQAHIFWIIPDIGVAIYAGATITGSRAIQNYVIDAYTRYAASAMASINLMRSLAGFGFPLFAPSMYNALGYGWANTILALIAIVIGLPAPWFFWHYGERLRKRSKFAAGE